MPDLLSRLDDAVAGRYRVRRELGRGATAVVYLADDLKHHRPVAIKLMKPELRAAVGPERFLREIKVAAGLTHPNILSLHDSGDRDGLLYFVMPYVEGESLRDRLDRGDSIPMEEALQITTEIADALEHAHSKGLIHRDIKPENVLFQAGHAVVSDFGIARALNTAGQERITETGLTVGTIAYMSPEQAMGESDIDGRSDLYSLACVFYEMIAGGAPFSGANPQAMLSKKVVERPPSLRKVAPAVPETVNTVVTKALSPDPKNRFATVAQFASELSLANTTDVLAVAELRRSRTRRMRLLVGTVGVIALAFGGQRMLATVDRPEVERFALLPLVNFSNDPEQQYFVDAIHDGLIMELQQAGMRAVSSRSVLRYRDSDEPVREIASTMGLDALMTGRVRLTADSVVIELNLLDGETEESRWILRGGDTLENILQLQQRMTLAVAEKLQFQLTPEAEAQLSRARRVDPEAYEAYLRGMTHWRRLTPPDLQLAMQYFERALEIDPEFALGYAGIAMTWGALGMAGVVPRLESLARRRAANEKAMALGSDVAEVRLSDGLISAFGLWEFERGAASFRRAAQINPNYPEPLLYLGHVLLILNQPEEALEVMERGLALEPFDALYNGIYAQGLNFLGRFEEASLVAEEALKTTPGNKTLLGVLKSSYHLQGRHEEAIAAWREQFASIREFELEDALIRGWEEGGYSAALMSLGQLLLERRESGGYSVTAAELGTLFTRAGNADLALEWLTIAVAERANTASYFGVDHIFDELRDDPRFIALLERVGLPATR